MAEAVDVADDVTWGGGVWVGVPEPELHPKDKLVTAQTAEKARVENMVGERYHVCSGGRTEIAIERIAPTSMAR